MSRSPCIFRSAQCATLIALAAAAGISRFEPAQGVSSRESTPVARSEAAVSVPFGFDRYLVSMIAAVRKLPNQPVTTQASLDATALLVAVASEPLPPPSLQTLPAAAWHPRDFIAPLPRTHLIPYAVGPPAYAIHSCRAMRAAEAVGSRVVALSCFGFADVRPMGAEVTPSFAGLTHDPSSALRGEPITCPSLPIPMPPASTRLGTSSVPRVVATAAATSTRRATLVAPPSRPIRPSPSHLSSV